VVVKTWYRDQPWPAVFDDQIVYPSLVSASPAGEPPAYGDPRPLSETHPRYRAAWPRFWAAVIDNLVFFVPWTIVGAIVVATTDSRRVILLVGAVGSAGYALYDVVMHANGGKTVGKMATGVTVVDAKTLAPITWRQAWLRSAGIWLVCVQSLVGAISLTQFTAGSTGSTGGAGESFGFMTNDPWTLAAFICMLVTPQRRALHDLIAGTAVVNDNYTARAPAGPPPSYVPAAPQTPPTSPLPPVPPPPTFGS
jgi:uncharacterized RDD family membrane protein YckC